MFIPLGTKHSNVKEKRYCNNNQRSESPINLNWKHLYKLMHTCVSMCMCMFTGMGECVRNMHVCFQTLSNGRIGRAAVSFPFTLTVVSEYLFPT